jgi:cytochrome c peroxidase
MLSRVTKPAGDSRRGVSVSGAPSASRTALGTSSGYESAPEAPSASRCALGTSPTRGGGPKPRSGVWVVVGVLVLLVASGCDRSKPDDGPTFSAQEVELIGRLAHPGPPPVDETNAVVDDERAARLGQFLFFDERLSANGEVACSTCHRPEDGFSVTEALGEGVAKTPRHPPSLLNAAYHHWYDWDGKADSLWAQAVNPMESPVEMAFSRVELAHLIAGDDELRSAYEAIFEELPDLSDRDRFPERARPVADDPEHPDHRAWAAMSDADRQLINRILTNATKAIAAYQSKLVRNDSAFDRFVDGLREEDDEKLGALSDSAQRGLKLFMGEAGCVRCHSGPTLTDGDFHNLGLGPREWLSGDDNGRRDGVLSVKSSVFNASGPYSDDADGKRAQWVRFLTSTPEDPGQFKTPTLRNVSLTAPYMHGGHFETLEEVVRFYSLLNEPPQTGHREEMLEPLGLSDRQVDDLVAFLESLTGAPLADELTRQPASPE